MNELSDTEYKVIVAASTTSSCLSIFGSLSILWIAATHNKNHENNFYYRLMMGLSGMDLITTTSLLVMPYAIRKDSGLLFAIGNAKSCEAAAFFFQFFLGSTIYNANLSLYFVGMIRYRITEGDIASRMEPYCHLVAFLLPLALGIVGLSTSGFNPILLLGICDFASFPENCNTQPDVECQRGDKAAEEIGWIHAILLLLAAITGVVATFLVYWTVRQQTLITNRHRYQQYPRQLDGDTTQLRRIRAVGIQAICYTTAFLVVFLSVTLYAALVNDPTAFWPKLVVYTLFPLAGFLNCAIFIRPRLLRWKDANGDRSWFWAYRQVLSGKPAPTTRRTAHLARTQTRQRASTSTMNGAAFSSSRRRASSNAAQREEKESAAIGQPPTPLAESHQSHPPDCQVILVEEEEEEANNGNAEVVQEFHGDG